jgi:hypothetical protein
LPPPDQHQTGVTPGLCKAEQQNHCSQMKTGISQCTVANAKQLQKRLSFAMQ